MWITLFSIITLLIWFSGSQADARTKLLSLLGLTGGSLFILWFSARLKTVRLVGDSLVISDYRMEKIIPLHDIDEVKETRIWNPKLIKLRLMRPRDWGDEIIFIAPMRLQFVFSDHPLTRELRNMIREKQRGTGQQTALHHF